MTVELWTPDEAAAFLKTTTQSLAYYRKKGNGPPFVKLGRQVRYVPNSVMKWSLDSQQTSVAKQDRARLVG